MIGYICAWLRYYYPYAFVTSYLNNAANDADIKAGTELAKLYGISITPPRFGISIDSYMFDEAAGVISKGVSSVKFLNKKVAKQFYKIYHSHHFDGFMDVLKAIDQDTDSDDRQISNLIRIDYFAEFGNVAELLKIYDIYKFFKRGQAKTMKKEKLGNGVMHDIVAAHSTDRGVNGNVLKAYTIEDMDGILSDCERYIKMLEIPDVDIRSKINDQLDLLGYIDIATNKPSDRKNLIVLDTYPLKSKATGETWGVALNVRSIGTGNEARLTVRKAVFDQQPLKKLDVIRSLDLSKNRSNYWYLNRYELLV